MCDDAWFCEAIYLAACEQVFQWRREREISQHCSIDPSDEHLEEFLTYFQVARTIRRDNRSAFLEFVSRDLRQLIAALPNQQPNFVATPGHLRNFVLPSGRRSLSALSKWVLVTNQGSVWTPFDQFVCAALGIRGTTEAKFATFYARIHQSGWEAVCSEIDPDLVPSPGFSIARVFDKFLFLAGSEKERRGGWNKFSDHAHQLNEEQLQRARELAGAILGSPQAVALLKALIRDAARQALQRAYTRNDPAPRPGGGAQRASGVARTDENRLHPGHRRAAATSAPRCRGEGVVDGGPWGPVARADFIRVRRCGTESVRPARKGGSP